MSKKRLKGNKGGCSIAMCDMARARNFFERLTKETERISILEHQGIRKKK
jgi:hypothetical protein